MANGQFGNQLSLSPADQQRIRMAQAMQKRGMQGQNRTPLEAIGNTLMNVRGQQQQEAVADEQAKRRQAYADTMRRVSQAGQQGTVTGPGGGGTGEVATAKQRMIDALSSNPDTAPTAAQMQLSQALQPEQARTQTISGEAANQMFGTTLSPGAAVTIEAGPQGRRITNVQEPPKRDRPTYDSVNVLMPDNETQLRGRETDQGELQIKNEQGEWVNAPRGATTLDKNLSGGRDELGLGKPAIRKFKALEARMPVVNRLQKRISAGLSSGEFVGGISGDATKLFNSLRSQVGQVYSAFNKGKSEDERDASLDVGKYDDTLGEVTNVNTKVKSGILDLAYMTLKAKGEERVSDQDIRLELQSYGLDTNDPQIIMGRVNDKIGDLYANYGARAQNLGLEPQYEFTPQTGGGGNAGQGASGDSGQSDPLGLR